MTPTENRMGFRAVLEGDACVHPASVFDPMSARSAADLGFETAMFAGSVASMTVLGAPDLVVLTLSEFADQARRICRAGAPPLLVDADHGYGNALNVRRTVEELETAGVSAMTVEDTELPVAYGGEGARLISVEEGAGKMRAALDARADPSFVIAGRTSAVNITGIEDAAARAKAYQAEGVDAMFFAGIQTEAQLEAVAAALDIPILLGALPREVRSLETVASYGVRICLQGHMPFAAAVRAAYDTLAALRDGADPADLGAPKPMMDRLTRDADYRRWLADFLGRS